MKTLIIFNKRIKLFYHIKIIFIKYLFFPKIIKTTFSFDSFLSSIKIIRVMLTGAPKILVKKTIKIKF